MQQYALTLVRMPVELTVTHRQESERLYKIKEGKEYVKELNSGSRIEYYNQYDRRL